jgi:hypothetical protein
MKIKNRKAKDPRKKFFCLQQDQMENLFFDTHCNIPNILSQLKLSTYKDLKPLLPKEYGGCVSVARYAILLYKCSNVRSKVMQLHRKVH